MRFGNDSKSGRGIAAALVAALALGAGTARAQALQGLIETPTEGEIASGIGTLSGWHCAGQVITLRIDAFAPLVAGSGTERLDTQATCGRADTGFSLLFNYNNLPLGAHTVIAFADGVEFSRATFTTVTLGTDFLRGKSGTRLIRNFPNMNESLVLGWRENRQNFAIVARGNGTTGTVAPIAGSYYGATGTQCASDPQPAMSTERFARFDVSLTPDNQTLTTVVRYADGFVCQLSGAMTDGGNGYFVVAAPASTCQLGTTGLRIEVDGLRIKGVIGSVPGTGCMTTRAFYGARAYALE
jgi:hypothetical protein